MRGQSSKVKKGQDHARLVEIKTRVSENFAIVIGLLYLLFLYWRVLFPCGNPVRRHMSICIQ